MGADAPGSGSYIKTSPHKTVSFFDLCTIRRSSPRDIWTQARKPTWTYSTGVSSPTSLLGTTFVAGKELGVTFSSTFCRELVIERDAIVTVQSRAADSQYKRAFIIASRK